PSTACPPPWPGSPPPEPSRSSSCRPGCAVASSARSRRRRGVMSPGLRRTYEFTAALSLHNGMPGAWYFVTLPLEAADEIRAANERRGFGSVRVHAAIGDSRWDTSVFPDAKTGSFLLPVKAAVRRAQDIDDGSLVTVSLTTIA